MFTETKTYIPVFTIGDVKVYGKNLEMIQFDPKTKELKFWFLGRENPLVVSTEGYDDDHIRSIIYNR